jgi:hypothetical protein
MTPMHGTTRRSCLLVTALGLLLLVQPATAANGTNQHPPVKLWQAYPLEQKPSAGRARDAPTPKPGQPRHVRGAGASRGHAKHLPLATALPIALLTLLGAAGALLVLTRHAAPTRWAGVVGWPGRDTRLPRRKEFKASRVVAQRASPSPQRESQPPEEDLSTALDPRLRSRTAHERRAVECDTCRIAAWHGYFKTQFYAARPVAAQHALDVSPMFRAPGGSKPQRTNEAEHALATLLARLENDDWTVARQGRQWFELTLERPQPARTELRAASERTTSGSDGRARSR